MNDKTDSFCFLCNSSSIQSKSLDISSCSWPSTNLDIIYLLTKLLRVPRNLLIAHLRKCGNNPDSWIDLCDQCIHLIKTARKLHHDIRKFEKELIRIQEQVLGKIRTTNDNQRQGYHGKNSRISDNSFQEKVKLLVMKHTPLNSKNDDDDDDHRLQEGDQLAKQLAVRESPSKTISPVGSPVPEEIKEEEDEPSPPPPMSPLRSPSQEPEVPSSPPEVPSAPAKSPSPSRKLPQISPNSSMTTPVPPKKVHPRFAKRFNCSECGKAFTFARKWAEHLLKIHKIRDITCPGQECSEKFNDDLVKFQDHWKANHLTWSGKTCTCPDCGKVFKNRHSYSTHKRNKHSSNQATMAHFICDICGVQKTSFPGWYQHRRNKHPEIMGIFRKATRKPFKPMKQILKNQLCQICGKTIKGKGNLRKHMRNVHEKRFSQSCHVCGLGMPSSTNLKFHLLTRHKDDPVTKQLEEEKGIKLWKCGIVGCEVKFLLKDKLDKHMEKFHKDGQDGVRRYKCQYCEKGFWSRQKLRWHEDAHEGKGKEGWKCEICGKGFDTKHYLKYHLKHTHKVG